MDESQEVVPAEVSAPEQVATAAPEPEVTAPEAVEPAAEAPKTFSQEELDAAIGKRLAREQRKWEREQAAKAAEKQLKTPVEIPPIEQFNSPEEYADLLAERKAEELLARREQARMQSETLEAFADNTVKLGTYSAASGSTMIVTGSRVGIGTTSPQTPLQILRDTTGNGTNIEEANMAFTVLSAAGQSKISIGASNAGNYGYVQVMQDATSWTSRNLTLQPRGGNVGIGTYTPAYRLEVSTDSAAKPSTNTWTIASDSRVKENIRPYSKGLDALLQINPIEYDYNGKANFIQGYGGIGIIAQDVLGIIPEGVSTYFRKLNPEDEEDTELYNFNSHPLTYIMINAIKELKAEIEVLKNK